MKTFLVYVYLIALIAIMSLIMAYPVMWCWNYAIVYIWKLPVISWGHAWCLTFLSSYLIKSYNYNGKN